MSREPVRFSNAYASTVESYTLAGFTTNAEMAMVLRSHFDDRITERDIARWRKQNGRFERACAMCLHTTNAEMVNIVLQSAREGNVNDAKWWLERRSPAFMPKSKVESQNTVTLDDSLRRRAMSDDEARNRGLIYDPVEDDDQDLPD